MIDLDNINKAKSIIDNYERRVKFCFLPTPLQFLERLSTKLGVNLFLKRDDLTGPGVFGGNKGRKLEYLIGDALAKGASHIFTYGATQSNHVMQVATVCRKYGLKPVLYLSAIIEPEENEYRANLLVDKILGAEIHILPGDINPDERHNLALRHIADLEMKGNRCYDIPGGGANAIGSLGYIRGFIELVEQARNNNIGKMDYIAHATGSGGTLAGLLAGKALLGSEVNILSFTVSNKTSDYQTEVINLANQSLNLLNTECYVGTEYTNIDNNYYGEGYEIPTDEANNTIKLLAREEGILLDPVYTAKAMSGVIDYIKKGKIPIGSNVFFLYTGGVTALFSEKEILGNLLD